MSYIDIFVGGDIVNYHQRDGRVLEQELESLVQEADYAVCNFEAPIAGFGKPIPKSGPHHSQLPETIEGLKSQGFNLLLLANNHIMDFGYEGLKATIDRAKEAKLETLGAGCDSTSAYKPLIKVVGGVKIGMLNACEAQFGVLDYFRECNEPGYAWVNHHAIDQIVLELKNTCDYVIVFSHAGLEHYSIPQKEWRIRYKSLCDAGADAVIGSHPHVPQGYEEYNGSMIFYSLGNFYFDSKNYLNKSDSTYSVMLRLFKEEKIVGFELIYHCKTGGKTKLANVSERVDVGKLNYFLEESTYQHEHDDMSMRAYSTIVSNFRVSVSKGWYNGDLVRSLKDLVRRFILSRKPVDKDMLQLHLLRNEAYYYAARHALEIKHKDKHYSE